ncbi:MAG: M1 family aminopeptidase [Burkholderiales bacterium]|nr:M1 family aminopeptidase [Burkholderiales bacterium]
MLLPEFPYGGMEHAGATFLNEERVLLPQTPSATERLRRAQLLLHEAAHQWFGNLVTLRWFDDLWLKEGFANFMTAKALEALAPEFDAWVAFHALKTSAVRIDTTRGATPIRHPLENLADAKSAYGPIAYGKAPALLRQAEFLLGEPVFRRAVRDFLRQHAFGAADWRDLVRAFERASGRRLGAWAAGWVERAGAPTVRARWCTDSVGRIGEVHLEQHDGAGARRLWSQRLRVAAIGTHGIASAEVLLSRASVRVRALEGVGAPQLVLPNAGDFGYAAVPARSPEPRERARAAVRDRRCARKSADRRSALGSGARCRACARAVRRVGARRDSAHRGRDRARRAARAARSRLSPLSVGCEPRLARPRGRAGAFRRRGARHRLAVAAALAPARVRLARLVARGARRTAALARGSARSAGRRARRRRPVPPRAKASRARRAGCRRAACRGGGARSQRRGAPPRLRRQRRGGRRRRKARGLSPLSRRCVAARGLDRGGACSARRAGAFAAHRAARSRSARAACRN